ncbi:ABC transporter ATP-binding protein [Bacillus sp. Marseille-P3661]|uniref:ABC transporter ATP-binding protein n=1 Tax=Bacillus sp. Marseille-P3661 TaxID=1936234 RepID=UPI000C8582D9|nr:sn-glycerol-3-phosphate ABC transporter ATP-binding protein UgpC [Bacillus sp. Marseille-P3661]
MGELKLEHVFKYYDSNKASVNDFNLHIKEKEFVVFVGPSGCGKSTTLRMIAGLEDISKGDLYIEGIRVNDVSPKDRDIAMVFQNYALYPHMNVFDNMAFGLKLKKVPKDVIKNKVQAAATMLGLEEYLYRKPKALSGGQRQRVALGRAIIRDAKIFLMDEPLSNLDAQLRTQMRAEIIKLHQSLQTTTIYVTHDQTEAITMATRIVVMKDGVIQQVGTPKEVYNNPENMFVGGFIGTPAMNFLTGIVQEGKFKIGDVEIVIPKEKLFTLKGNGYKNCEIVIGIRPENVHRIYEDNSKHSLDVIHATVDVAELMGSETLLYLKLGGQTFTAKVSANEDVLVGESIPINLDLNKAHFFDKDSGLRIR